MIDLHMHSQCSDGHWPVAELFARVKAAGITTFSLTDHDVTDGVAEMESLAKDAGLGFIRGVEFSCLIDPGDGDSDCHILAYDYDPDNERLRELQQRCARFRKEKLEELLDYLKPKGIVLPEPSIEKLRAIDNFGKPALAKEIVALGLMTEKQIWQKEYLDGFQTLLRPGAEETIAIIKDAGGIAVWAHPFDDKEKREDRDSVEKFEGRFRCLHDFGIQGLECAYSKYEEDEIAYLVDTARANGLYITGGSDYHNPKPEGHVALGQTGLTRSHPELIQPFVEYIRER